MNITSIINTEKLEDIPNALRKLADIVERDIKISGVRANSIGYDPNIGDFDYQIDQTSITSLNKFIRTYE